MLLICTNCLNYVRLILLPRFRKRLQHQFIKLGRRAEQGCSATPTITQNCQVNSMKILQFIKYQKWFTEGKQIYIIHLKISMINCRRVIIIPTFPKANTKLYKIIKATKRQNRKEERKLTSKIIV